MKVTLISGIVVHAMHDAHRRLCLDLLLPGEIPRVNMHSDRLLPAALFQVNTNCLAVCTPKMMVMLESEIISAVKDAMAMCGCYRQYQSDKRAWNHSQNKGRLPVPALAMQETPKWRSIRSKL